MLRVAWLAMVLVPVSAWGQLYLIAGTPTPKMGAGFATSLLSVQKDGSIVEMEEVIPGQLGSEWITISYDAHKAVLLSREPDNKIIVLDLAAGSVVKSCKNPDSTAGQFLFESPTRGLMFAGYGRPPAPLDKPALPELLGMILDPSVSCEESFVKLAAADVNHPALQGNPALPSENGDILDVAIGEDGALSEIWISGDRTSFDYKVPTGMFDYSKHLSALIEFNNREVLGVSFRAEGAPHLVFRKRDQKWLRVPIDGWVRTFGHYLVTAESLKKTAQTPVSAGENDWRREDAPTGPPTRVTLAEWPGFVFPGILHLYNIETERLDTIVTNQGDSEILLVENDTVYYRVADRLYSAPITSKGIGTAQLLAKDDIIRDSHWAFIKH